MAVTSLRHIPVYVWIPPVYSALYKVEIVASGTAFDITDIILDGEIVNGATDTIGSFNFTIDNSSEDYMTTFNGGDILNFYCDYDTTATTKRFRGIIEKVSYANNTIKISGRSDSLKLLDITVTKAYEGIETSVILKDLISTYTTFTTTNVNTGTATATANWYQKPLMECIQELCTISGFDFYIDTDLDCHYFESGTIVNNTECVVHDANIMEIGDFAYDHSIKKNRVIVYGGDIGDLPLIATAEDIAEGETAKELIINDSNISTMTQAQDRANYELNLAKNPPLVGDVTCIGLATIQPGETVHISAPDNNLQPDLYKILSYRHRFKDFFETTLTINKESKKFYHLMRDRISNEQSLASQPNANEMRYTWNFDFNEDSGTHSNTQIVDGVLKSTSSGTWISEVKYVSSNATACELRANGTALSGTNWYISTDNGINWTSLSLSANTEILGQNLKIKVVLNSASTQVDSLVLLYK